MLVVKQFLVIANAMLLPDLLTDLVFDDAVGFEHLERRVVTSLNVVLGVAASS